MSCMLEGLASDGDFNEIVSLDDNWKRGENNKRFNR